MIAARVSPVITCKTASYTVALNVVKVLPLTLAVGTFTRYAYLTSLAQHRAQPREYQT